MAIDYGKLKGELARGTDAAGSVKTLVQKLLAEIEQIAKSADAPTKSQLEELTKSVDAELDELVGATCTGTEADPYERDPDAPPSPAKTKNPPAEPTTYAARPKPKK